MKKKFLSILSILTVFILSFAFASCAKKGPLKQKDRSKDKLVSWEVNNTNLQGKNVFSEYAVYEEIDWSQVTLRKKETIGKRRKVVYGDPVQLSKEDITNLDEIERAIDQEQTIDDVPHYRGLVKFVKDGIAGSFMLQIARKRYVFPVENYFIFPKTEEVTIKFPHTSTNETYGVGSNQKAVKATKLSTQKKWEVREGATVGERFLKAFPCGYSGYKFNNYKLDVLQKSKSGGSWSIFKQRTITPAFNVNLDFKDEDDDFIYKYRITSYWIEDTLKIRYWLNLPEDRELEDGAAEPQRPEAVEVNRITGNKKGLNKQFELPDTKYMNQYKSHVFMGWAKKINGKYEPFKFESGKEASSLIDLYAMWELRRYDFTLYVLGGNLGKTAEKAEEVAESSGNITEGVVVESIYAEDHLFPASYKIRKIPYGKSIGEVVAEFEIFNDKASKVSVKKKLSVSDLMAKLNKSEGTSIISWHTAVPFEDGNKIENDIKINNLAESANGREVFPLWRVDDSKLATYLVESVFYGENRGYKINEDGTVSFLKVRDKTISELKIPEKVEVEGIQRRVVEIGGCDGLGWLTKIDLSESKITTINDAAFSRAKNLAEVILPKTITHIGNYAFRDTKFIKNRGNIVIFAMGDENQYLYKVNNLGGTDTIDLTPYKIQTIGISAFDNFKVDSHQLANVKKIKLGSQLKEIKRNAFSNLTDLEEIEIASSTIENIDHTALTGTKLLSDKIEAKEPIILGNVLFKVSDSDLVDYTIPDGVNALAQNAFSSCNKIETINNMDKIRWFGEDALSACTKYLNNNKNEEGLVIINGKLVSVIGSPEFIHIDPSVKEIVAGALKGSDPTQLKEVYIYSNEIKISENAFKENVSLSKIVFLTTEVSLVDNLQVGRNAIPSGVKVYVQQAVKEGFAGKVDGIEIINIDELTYRIYKQNESKFVVLVKDTIEVNNDIPAMGGNKAHKGKVADKHLRRKGTFTTINNIFGSDERVEKGLRVKYKNLEGVAYEDLLKSEIESAFIDGVLNQEGEHTIAFEKEGKQVSYTYRVVNAPDESKIIKVVGLETKYYTNNASIDITNAYIVYQDVDGVERRQKITEDDVESYKPEVGQHKRFVFRINLPNWGLCTKEDGSNFEVIHEYEVAEAQIKEIKQVEKIKYKQGKKVDSSKVIFKLIKEDGEKKIVTLLDANLTLLKFDGAVVSEGDKEENKVIKTDELGLHTIEFKYEKDGKEIEGVYVYTVVFEADIDVFEYELGKDVLRIKKVKTQHGSVLVVPSSVNVKITKNPNSSSMDVQVVSTVDAETKKLIVAEIGDKAFLDQKDITKVYIPNTVKKIGSEAFKGCTSLSSIELYDTTEISENSYISEDIFKTIIKDKEESHNTTVTINGYQFLDRLHGDIKIPTNVEIREVREETNVGTAFKYEYRIVYNAKVEATKELFEDVDNKLGTKKLSIPRTKYYLDLLECEYTLNEDGSIKEIVKLEGKEIYKSNNTRIQEKFNKEMYKFYDPADSSDSTEVRYFKLNDNYKTKDTNPVRKTKLIVIGLQNIDAVLGTYDKVNGKHILVKKYLSTTPEDGEREIIGYTPGAFDELETKLTDGGKLYLPDGIEIGTNERYIELYSQDKLEINEIEDVFSDKVEEIGSSAFLGAKLDKFKFPTKDGVALKKIGQSAFTKTKIEVVDLSKATLLTEINTNVFESCDKLTTVKLNANIVKLGARAFADCKMLTTIDHDFTVLTSIGQQALYKCPNLHLAITLNKAVYKGLGENTSVNDLSPNIQITWID